MYHKQTNESDIGIYHMEHMLLKKELSINNCFNYGRLLIDAVFVELQYLLFVEKFTAYS